MASASRLFDLTLALDDAIRLRHTSHTTVSVMRFTPDGSQVVSDVSFSPHGITHIDAAPFDSDDGDRDTGAQTTLRVSGFGTFRCVIIDVSGRGRYVAEVLKEAAEAARFRVVDYPYLPTSTVWGQAERAMETYRAVLEALAIDEEELVSALPRTDYRGTNAVLLLHTDWRRFAPAGNDLGHALWQAWHPYCVRPFLTACAVRHIEGMGFSGVGTDTDDADCPLRECYRDPETEERVPTIALFPHGIAQHPEMLSWATAEDLDARFSPLHSTARERRWCLLENLSFPPDLFTRIPYIEDRRDVAQPAVVEGWLSVHLMPWGSHTGAVPVQATLCVE